MNYLVFTLSAVLAYPLSAAGSSDNSNTYFPQRMSANKLLTTCASSTLTPTGRSNINYCQGFVSGVEEGIRLYGKNVTLENRATICVPSGTSARELATAYVKYASGVKVDLNVPAAKVVVDALISTFSC